VNRLKIKFLIYFMLWIITLFFLLVSTSALIETWCMSISSCSEVWPTFIYGVTHSRFLHLFRTKGIIRACICIHVRFSHMKILKIRSEFYQTYISLRSYFLVNWACLIINIEHFAIRKKQSWRQSAQILIPLYIIHIFSYRILVF
jgi:hypothetical protein